MTKETRGGGSATTVDDLPDNLRIALRSGFRAAYWLEIAWTLAPAAMMLSLSGRTWMESVWLRRCRC